MYPVFIGGCGRSGTTLLGAMIGGNSACLTIPEATFKLEFINYFRKYSTKEALGKILGYDQIKLWGVKPSILAEHFGGDEISFAKFFSALIFEYSKTTGKLNYSHWIDHTPCNTEYELLLLKHFKNARFIHIIRDGRAVANSVVKLDWGPNTLYQAASWWVSRVAFGLALETIFSSDVIIRVKYEDLINETDRTLKKISDFLSIEFTENMLTGTGFLVPKYTKAQHKKIGKPINASRINSWEEELTQKEIEIFENYTKEFLTYLGYELKYNLNTTGLNTKEKIGDVLIENYRKHIRNRIRKKQRTKLMRDQ